MPELREHTTYKIINAKAQTVLDVSGTDGRTVSGYTFNGGDNQRWRVHQDHLGRWMFKTDINKYLGIEGPPRDGAMLIAVDEPQSFNIWPDEHHPGAFKIYIPDTEYVLDLSDHGNATPGTIVTLWAAWKGQNQAWIFDEI